MTTIYEHAGKKYRLADQRDIGKEVYLDDLGFDTAMGGNDYPIVKHILAEIRQGMFRPFLSTGGVTWTLAFVELTKEELQALYTERQAAWVAENDVKPGTKVRVTRTAKGNEDGWGDSWIVDMDKYVGKELTVNRTDGSSMHLSTGDDSNCWNFPYFVLEVVKEPQWRLMGPEEIIGPDCRYTNFPEDAAEPLDVFCGGWIPLKGCSGDFGTKVKEHGGCFATQRPLPATKVEVTPPPTPTGYEVVPESEYASYVPTASDYFLGGSSNSWLPLYNPSERTCADLRNEWGLDDQLYAAFARRVPVVAERPEAPEGWRWLTDDEIIQKGDSYWSKRRAVEDAVPDLVHSTIGNTYGKLKASPHWSHIWGVLRKVEPVVAERPKVEEKPDLWRLLGDEIAKQTLNSLCESIHAKNVKAGWWDAKDNPLVVPTKLALIHSEVSEALEGHRKGLKDDKLPEYDMVAVELADVLIRVFDLAGFLNIPLGTIIEAKERYNAQRADHKPENRKAVGGKRY